MKKYFLYLICILTSIVASAQTDAENQHLNGNVKTVLIKKSVENWHTFNNDSVVSEIIMNNELFVFNKAGFVIKNLVYNEKGKVRWSEIITRTENNKIQQSKVIKIDENGLVYAESTTTFNYQKNSKHYIYKYDYEGIYYTTEEDSDLNKAELISSDMTGDYYKGVDFPIGVEYLTKDNYQEFPFEKCSFDEHGNWTYCAIIDIDRVIYPYSKECKPLPPPNEFQDFKVYYRTIEYWE